MNVNELIPALTSRVGACFAAEPSFFVFGIPDRKSPQINLISYENRNNKSGLSLTFA